MTRRLTTIVAVILGCSAAAGHAEEKTRRLSCTGVMIEPAAVSQSPKTAQLSLGSQRTVAIDLGQADIKARVISDNKIQLKFRAKDFVGELFHYTNDLFLIYNSGHLARLTCKSES